MQGDDTSGRDTWPAFLPERRWMVLGAICLLALALRLLYLWDVSASPFFTGLVVDQRPYNDWAIKIAAGDWLGSAPFYQDPLYPYFLAVIYKIAGRSLPVVYVIQATLSTLCCLLVYGVARRSFRDERAALLAALLWASFKVDFFYSAQLLKTSPGLCLLMLGLWLLLKTADDKKTAAAAGAGLVMGLLLLVRGNYFLVAPPLIVWAAYQVFRDERAKALRIALALGLCFMAVPLLTMARNRAVSGQWVITTAQGGPNFYMGNFRENRWGIGIDPSFARRVPGLERQDFKREAERRTGKKMTDAEADSFWYREGLREIAADPGLAAARLVRKMLLIVNRHEVSDNLNYDFFREHYSFMLKLPLPGFWLAAPFGIAGILLALRDKKGALLALFVLFYSVTLLVFYILGRYRLPLAPALLCFAAYGAVRTMDAFGEKDKKTVAIFVSAVFLIAALGFPRWGEYSFDRAWVKVGNVYANQGQPQEAIDAYQKALEINPELYQAWVGLGLALESRLRSGEAIAAYARAAELAPEDAHIRLQLGLALERQGDRDGALKNCKAALSIDPEISEAKSCVRRLERAE